MENISIKLNSRVSNILVGESLDNLSGYLPNGRTIIISDSNVLNFYRDSVVEFDIIEIGVGEETKTLETVNYIINKLVELEADRSTFILGFGGGLVCDIAGLVASVYMRGLKFGFVATSLLAQVDASIGGKNGVNVGLYKNLFGVFNQPQFVICDINLLKTLPENEFISGLAEVVKYGLIKDPEIINILERETSSILVRDSQLLKRIISMSVAIKKEIVEEDEHETNMRRILNFGHTIGHAIERLEDRLHGEAVSIGTIKALELSSYRLGLDPSIIKRIKSLLTKLGLPIQLSSNSDDIIRGIRKDKKRNESVIKFVLLEQIAKPIIEEISIIEIDDYLKNQSTY